MAAMAVSACGNLPCALKSYVRQAQRREPFGGLPQYACLIAFLHWAAKSTRRTALESPQTELRCPMLWCRDSFEDLSAMLQHIPLCPCLDDGYYWCTDCSRPERFMEKGKPLKRSLKTDQQCQRKDSKLKRAAGFFKGFGHVSSHSKHRAKTCGNTVLEASGAILTLGLTTLIERKRRKAPCGPDLDSGKEVLDPEASILREDDLLHQLYKLDNLETEDLCKLLDDFGTAESFLRSETFSSGLQVVAPPDINTSFSQLIPQFELDHTSCAELDGTEQHLESTGVIAEQWRPVSPLPQTADDVPFSPTPVSPFVNGELVSVIGADETALDPAQGELKQSERASNGVYPNRSIPAPRSSHRMDVSNPTISPRSSAAEPSSLLLYSTPDHMSLPEADRDSRFLEDCTFRSAEARVKEICGLVSVVNQEWLERMTGSPRLLARCAGLSTTVLFEKGITALQHCFRGILPDTFLEVFGLMHIACAVAYSFHKEDDWWMWEELSMDMSHWQDTLTKDSEKEFFLEALSHLNRPRTPPGGWLKQLNPASSSYEPLGSIEQEVSGIMLPSNMLLNETHQSSVGDLFSRLRGGRVMQDCVRFLDHLEHSVLAERNKALLPGHFAWYTQQKTANITHLLEHVIWPLQTMDGFEALRDIVVDAEFQVKSGLLRTPREIEVALVYGGKLYSKNMPYYERFKAAVKDICNKAMQTTDPSWRDAYYATGLNRVLAIAFELQSQKTEDEETDTSTDAAQEPDIVLQPKRMRRPNPPPPLAINTTRRSPRSSSTSTHSSRASAIAFASTPSTAPSTSPSSLQSFPSSRAQFTTPLSTTSFTFAMSPTSKNAENFTLSPTSASTSAFAPSSAFSSPHSSTYSSSFPPLPPLPHLPTCAGNSDSITSGCGPNAENEVTYCPSCPAKFTGNYQYRRSNLRRHLRTTSKHGGTAEGPRCPEEGCGKVFSRTDNLSLHIHRAHGGGRMEGLGDMNGEGSAIKRRRWKDAVAGEERDSAIAVD